jgi:Skp family chaperone for outer membrane proteins
MVLGLALLMLTAAPVMAEIPQVGVVDMLRVSEGYERYVAMRQVLERKKNDLQTLVDDEEKDVLGLIEELETIRTTAGQDEIARRRSEIERRDRELRQFVMQTNMQFRDELDTLQLRTRDEIETVVIAIATARGLTLVLERNMTLFASVSLDITAAVVSELNARYRPLPAAVTPPRPAAGPSARPGAGTTTPSGGRPSGTDRRGWPFRD